jgi:hypothetical protein
MSPGTPDCTVSEIKMMDPTDPEGVGFKMNVPELPCQKAFVSGCNVKNT